MVAAGAVALWLAAERPVIGQGGLTSPIVFVSRAIPRSGHIADPTGLTGSMPGVGTISRFVVATPGKLLVRETNGSIRTLVDGSNPTAQSLNLVDVNAPEVSYDGRRIVFAGLPNGNYTADDRSPGAHPGAWRIYTINADGTGLRQVTTTPPALDLSQFNFPNDFNRSDDTDPNWLPDGRIVFSSTRWPAVAQYRDPRTTNLYVVNADGSRLHRVTAERNGADRPLIDPVTGRVVYSRWWRNSHMPSDTLAVRTDPVFGGYLLNLGLTTDDSGRYSEAELAAIGPAMPKSNRNLWISASINPDGTDLTLWDGGSDEEPLINSAYGGSFDEAGNLYSNLIPLENLAEVAGFGGIRYHRRGVTPFRELPGQILGVTEFLPQLPLVFPQIERVYVHEYASEPEVVPNSNLLVASIAPDYRQDYGLYLVSRDGSSRQLLYNSPGTTELRARLIRARTAPPVIADQGGLGSETASLLPPRSAGPYNTDGTFTFASLNVFFNAPVDTNIVSAPPIGSAASIRFYADFIRDSATTNSRYNWPVFLGERAIASDGSVTEQAPANVPLFEQLRSSTASGYRVPLTNPPNQGQFVGGAGHVAGMNFGRPGTVSRCVGCHQGHTLIPVPATAEAARFTNLGPGALVTTSSTGGGNPEQLINRRVRTEAGFEHWRSANGQSPNTQWVQLTFPVPVLVRTVRLWGSREVSGVEGSSVRLYSDAGGTSLAAQAASGSVADTGTNVNFSDIPTRTVRVAFTQVNGTQASLSEIEVIAAAGASSGTAPDGGGGGGGGGGGTVGQPPSAPTNVRIIQ